MQLEDLHEEHLMKLPAEMHLDYLLTSSAFLLKNDLNGWLKTFKTSSQPTVNSLPTQPIKRKRGAEMYPTFNSTFKETRCEECSGETIEDAIEGHVVCIKCGLIQRSPIYHPDCKVRCFLKLCFLLMIVIRLFVLFVIIAISRVSTFGVICIVE
jgi:hypothetical protein